MADEAMDFEASGKFSELQGGREPSFDDGALVRSNTNILNLENEDPEMDLEDGADQIVFDDQGSGSDEEPGPEVSMAATVKIVKVVA